MALWARPVFLGVAGDLGLSGEAALTPSGLRRVGRASRPPPPRASTDRQRGEPVRDQPSPPPTRHSARRAGQGPALPALCRPSPPWQPLPCSCLRSLLPSLRPGRPDRGCPGVSRPASCASLPPQQRAGSGWGPHRRGPPCPPGCFSVPPCPSEGPLLSPVFSCVKGALSRLPSQLNLLLGFRARPQA